MTNFAKLKAVAAVSAACAALFAAAPAQAYVYAMSHLEIQNLALTATPGSSITTGNFTFNQTNTATLSGGAPGFGTATCNNVGTPCGPAGDVLDAPVANAAASTLVRAENNFSFLGVDNVNSYSSADTHLTAAQLVTGTPTALNQIAESLLNTNGNAGATTSQQSNTVLTMNFTVGTGAGLTFNFEADPDMRSEIAGAIGNYLTQGDMSASFTLSQSAKAGFITWKPNGILNAADCIVAGMVASVTCAETADGADLNGHVSAELNPDTDDLSYDVAQLFTAFGIAIAGLEAGNYTLALSATTLTSIVRSVPEPDALALLGIALAGLAYTTKRRKQA